MSKFTGVWAIFEYLDETTDTIEQVQFTKFFTKEGRMVLIHDPNVLMVEVFQEEPDED